MACGPVEARSCVARIDDDANVSSFIWDAYRRVALRCSFVFYWGDKATSPTGVMMQWGCVIVRRSQPFLQDTYSLVVGLWVVRLEVGNNDVNDDVNDDDVNGYDVNDDDVNDDDVNGDDVNRDDVNDDDVNGDDVNDDDVNGDDVNGDDLNVDDVNGDDVNGDDVNDDDVNGDDVNDDDVNDDDVNGDDVNDDDVNDDDVRGLRQEGAAFVQPGTDVWSAIFRVLFVSLGPRTRLVLESSATPGSLQ
ncbi:putative uncharacterized protein DDB_G0287265 [Penaeus chinensis]|uniref:putative uncharacterized protein DDB_G0287265 n=1 Tax=Penaeus chinensis TaxID=139456 RepID=UPI001FB81DF9|nr:putative uncharacterized protein DDB_G0287265 [Penaeus chinensis]